MRSRLLVINLVVISCAIIAQEFKTPESSVYHYASKCYFVSNYGDGNIIKIDSAGKNSYFKTGLHKPLGMIIQSNILYVVNNYKSVKGYRLNDSELVFNLLIPEAAFLNDITCDFSGFIYVTDSNADAVFKINISDRTYTLLIKTDIDNPNGIIYDRLNNRLIICYFREQARIDAVSLIDTVRTILVEKDLVNLDGITVDESGNYYISSWGYGSFTTGFNEGGSIYKFDNRFTNVPDTIITGLNGPADIYYSRETGKLVIPLFLDDQVKFIDGQ